VRVPLAITTAATAMAAEEGGIKVRVLGLEAT
jgi:hypothetical protein